MSLGDDDDDNDDDNNNNNNIIIIIIIELSHTHEYTRKIIKKKCWFSVLFLVSPYVRYLHTPSPSPQGLSNCDLLFCF